MGLRATLLMLAAAVAATSMAATQLTAAQTVQQSAGAQPAIVVAANDAIEPPPSEAFMGAPEEAEAPVAAESFHVTAEDICAAKVEEAAEEAKAQAAAAEAKAQAQAADAEARAVAAESENAGLRGLLKAVRKMHVKECLLKALFYAARTAALFYLAALINLTLWPPQGASVSRVTHTHLRLRHSPKSPQACGLTA